MTWEVNAVNEDGLFAARDAARRECTLLFACVQMNIPILPDQQGGNEHLYASFHPQPFLYV